MRSTVLAMVAGCASLFALTPGMAAPEQSATVSVPTFTRDIAPIVFTHCANCHQPGAVAPFSLLTYADVRQRAMLVADVTARRVMPPWKPIAPRGTFLDDRSLDEQQISIIDRWVKAGAPEGRPEDLPPLPQGIVDARTIATAKTAAGAAADEAWQLGPPDLVLRMNEAYELAPDGVDSFRTFVLPMATTYPRYVRAVEFHPGSRAVHHANLGVDRTLTSRRRDAADPGPGYSGGMNPDAFVPGQMLGWTPGQTPRPVPEGTAWRVDPGTDFIAQLHMQPTGKAERIQVSVGLYFTDTPPVRTAVELRLGSRTIAIPAGNAAFAVSDSYVLPVDVEVTAIQPHAHNLARRMEATAALPDGTSIILIDLRDWDFRWQDVYRYANPIRLPRQTKISTRFTYDNSADNVRNPHTPPQTVYWGTNTADEMCDLWIQAIPVRNDDLNTLDADSGRKILAEDTASYEMLVARAPANAQLREDLALMYLEGSQRDKAIAALREALRLNPRSSLGHYSLGLALAMDRQTDAATREFQQAIAIDPDLGEAHTNLGIMLMQSARVDDAIDHFRTAVKLRPDSAEAHGNLGRALAITRKSKDAVDQFELAIHLKPDLLSALTALAWIRATAADDALRNPAEALRLADTAVSLTRNRDPGSLDVLAAAYAASGQFDRAVTAARSAADLATAAGAVEMVADIRSRLALYQQGVAYRVAR